MLRKIEKKICRDKRARNTSQPRRQHKIRWTTLADTSSASFGRRQSQRLSGLASVFRCCSSASQDTTLNTSSFTSWRLILLRFLSKCPERLLLPSFLAGCLCSFPGGGLHLSRSPGGSLVECPGIEGLWLKKGVRKVAGI